MQWLASKAHNLEVPGSSPGPATKRHRMFLLFLEKYTSRQIQPVSSVGSERLPYKQDVIGSNPIPATKKHRQFLFLMMQLSRLERSPQGERSLVRAQSLLPEYYPLQFYKNRKTKIINKENMIMTFVMNTNTNPNNNPEVLQDQF